MWPDRNFWLSHFCGTQHLARQNYRLELEIFFLQYLIYSFHLL